MNPVKYNKFGIQFLVLLALVLSISCNHEKSSGSSASGDYNYDKQGSDWTGVCQQGKQQSPIDLEDYNANEKSISPIRFSFYGREQGRPVTLINNGHTVNMDLIRVAGKPVSYIDGGLMPGVYEPISVHFHWGSPNSKGSEHTINNERYDVEMHIVHKNIDYFDRTLGEASWFSDGLAVLAVLIKAEPAAKLEEHALYKIFSVLPKIIKYQTNATIKGDFSLKQLFHEINTDEFYTYRGSLTTPTCAESVVWTVFKDIVSMPQSEISKLWDLEDSRKQPLINNYRQLQNHNGRRVFYRSHETSSDNSDKPILEQALQHVAAYIFKAVNSYFYEN